VTQVLVDRETGKMKDDILSEKVLYAIIEMRIKMEMPPYS